MNNNSLISVLNIKNPESSSGNSKQEINEHFITIFFIYRALSGNNLCPSSLQKNLKMWHSDSKEGGCIYELSIGFSEANKNNTKPSPIWFLEAWEEENTKRTTRQPTQSPRCEVTRCKYFPDTHTSVAEQIIAGPGAGQMTRPFKPK